VRRGQDLVEEQPQLIVRDLVEAERRMAHFGDALAEGGDVLGAEMGVEAERHLDFVDGLGGEPGVERGPQPVEGVVIALEAFDAVVDRKAGFRGLGQGADPCGFGEVLVRAIAGSIHGGRRLDSVDAPCFPERRFPGKRSAR
jgi:hypothetical protein